MPERIRAYRDGGERPWHVDIDGETLEFSEEDDAMRATQMLAGPGRLVVIDRRSGEAIAEAD